MCWHRDRGALAALFMAAAAAYFAGCENGPRAPAAPDPRASQGASELQQPAAPMSTSSGTSQGAAVICHRTGGARGFVRLSVASAAARPACNACSNTLPNRTAGRLASCAENFAKASSSVDAGMAMCSEEISSIATTEVFESSGIASPSAALRA